MLPPLPPPAAIIAPSPQAPSSSEQESYVSVDKDALDDETMKDDVSGEKLEDESVKAEDIDPHKDLSEQMRGTVILNDDLGHHIIVLSGDNKGFGDVLPPFELGNPTLIPTAGDAEDHDHMDPRYQSFIKGEAILWDEFLTHKYRTNAIALWNWQSHELIIEIEGDRTVCPIDTKTEDQTPHDQAKERPLNRDDIEQCLTTVDHSEDIAPTNFSNE